MSLPRRSPRRRAEASRVARLALASLAVVLIVANISGWGVFFRVLRTQEAELEQNLRVAAGLIAAAIPPDVMSVLDLSYDTVEGGMDFERLAYYAETLPSAESLIRSLSEVSAVSEDFDVALLAPTGEVIADPGGFLPEPQRPLESVEDADLLAIASLGSPAATPTVPSDATKRVYYPLVSGSGGVVAVLRLEADREYLQFVRRAPQRLIAMAVVSTALLLILWFALARLVKRAALAERAADQSDRLRALGTATAGIAHEIRNPLGIIGLCAEEIRAVAQDLGDEPNRKVLLANLDDLCGEVARLRDLTDQFLDFGRGAPRSGDAAPTDIGSATQAIVSLFRKGCPTRVDVRYTPPAEPLRVAFGEQRLRQVLLNLLRNACEAIADRPGRIDISADREKHRAVLTIRDNGPGMDAETLAQIFDPFFTTRSDGTGLGLSTSRSLVEAAGGELTLTSTPGEGTTARVAFPLI